MVKVGDRVQVASSKVGKEPRAGVVTNVRGAMLTVRWDSGEESSLLPAAGSLTTVAASRRAAPRKASAKKAGPKKAPPPKKAAKKAAKKALKKAAKKARR